MWPEISLSKRSIDNMGYRVCQLPEEDATIKEIVMIFDDYASISYDKDNVACALEYDTDFGLHTILFSKTDHLQYQDRMYWICIYSSNYLPGDDVGDGIRDSIPIEVLTDIYRDALRYIPKDPSDRSDIPEDVRRHLLMF